MTGSFKPAADHGQLGDKLLVGLEAVCPRGARAEYGMPKEARRAADRAVGAAPRDPAALLAAARAALVDGDATVACKLALRAVKTGARGAERDEAKRLAAGQLPRKRG